jgi:hypothetical protein
MKKLLVLALSMTLLIGGSAFATPAPEAPESSGCQGTWTSDTGCTFRYRGGGYSVTIGTLMGGGTVRLEVKDPDTGARKALLHCAATGFSSGCGAGQQ